MRYHIITLFPDAFASYLGVSIVKRAIEDKKISVEFYNPRDFAPRSGKMQSYADRRVDNKPYGGGPGMVIEALPVIKALDDIHAKLSKTKNKSSTKKTKTASTKSKILIVWFTPLGKTFTTDYARKASKYTDIIFICGRYEGIDARVKKIYNVDEISIGDFVLTGGELPAMIMIDCISRQIDGVLGDKTSLEETRKASPEVYTRPETLKWKNKNYLVPKVLLSGNHTEIESWRECVRNKAIAKSQKVKKSA